MCIGELIMKKIMFMIMVLVATVAFAEPTVKMISDERAGIVGTMTYFSDEEAKEINANASKVRNHFESEKKIYDNIAKMFGQPKFYDYVEAEFGYHFDKSWEPEERVTRHAQAAFNFCISDSGAYLWDYLEESNLVVFELACFHRDTNEEPFEFLEIVIINKNYVFLSVKNVEKN